MAFTTILAQCCILVLNAMSSMLHQLNSLFALYTQRLSIAGNRYSRSYLSGDGGVGISVACAGVSLGANFLPWHHANPPAAGEGGGSSAARLPSLCPQKRSGADVHLHVCCRGIVLCKLGDGISWTFADAWQEFEVNPGAKKPSDPSPSPASSAYSPPKWRHATSLVLPISSTLLCSLCWVFTSLGCILS